MALTDTTSAAPFALGKLLAAPFLAIGNWLIALGESNSRIQEVNALNALSDAELAKHGLRREDIVRHVFRDYMHM